MAGTLNKGSLVKGTGGSGGGGSASFPTIVTDSGSSLPSASGYQLNDTFLNTSDKKLYTAQVGGYALNTNASVQQNVVFDATSGVASNFTTVHSQYYTYTYGVVRSGVSVSWSGSGAKIRVHFKLNALPEDNVTYVLLSDIRGGKDSPPLRYCVDVRIVNKKLNLALLTSQYGTQTVSSVDIADTELLTNQEYYLEIEKKGNVATVTLATGGYGIDVIETNEVETQDHDLTGGTLGSQSISVGCSALSTNSGVAFSIGSIYLVDTTGEFVIADTSSLLWNGVALTKGQYADKTNGILYLYENNELVKIGGSSGIQALNVIPDGSSASSLIKEGAKIKGFGRDAYLITGAILENDLLSLVNIQKEFGTEIVSANSFEVVFLCNYKSKTATKQFIFGEKGGWCSSIGIQDGAVQLGLNFTGWQSSSSLTKQTGSYTFTEGADYFWKFAFDGSAYTLAIKGKNDENYTTVATITSSTKFSSGRDWIIGYVDTADTNNEWGSYIDFSESYIKIDGEYWWKGVESL